MVLIDMYRENNRGMRDWMIFIRTAEAGSLAESARRLNITTVAVSKSVKRLEDYLGITLFTRNVSGLVLTEAGHTTLIRAKEISYAFNSLLEEVRNPDNEIKGTIRLAAPAIVCEFLANRWIYEYTQKYPRVKIFLDSRERKDLRTNSPELDDLVLRSGRIESEDLVHRALSPVKLLPCVSTEYFNSHSFISHPQDLENHNVFGLHNNGLAGSVTLYSGDKFYTVSETIRNRISSNNLLAMLNLVIDGKGVSLTTPGWIAAGYIKNKKLIPILTEWKVPDLEAWLIWRQRPNQTPLFKHFRSYIEERWNERPKP